MTSLPERDDQVMTLMAAALPLAGEERSGYLHVACRGDGDLLQEVRDGIEWEERMGGFLQQPWMSLQDLERPFKTGQIVNNRFEIIREIGEGGMGIVYEAFDRKRAQRIAIKSAKLGFRRLLSPELESALRVRHRNICLVNEIHTAATEYGDVDFLTMELLEGTTLQDRLSSGGKLEPQEALEIARQLCAGLAEAHGIDIIHKDLKSANIILSRLPDGALRAVITDFGLAGEPAPESNDLAGTPQYMAPELWQGAAASKASDIYALGVILYEMVTGDKPFADEPTQTRLTRRPPPPSIRAGNLDKRWDAAILRCLDPSPAARPRDAMDVFALLTAPSFRKTPLVVAMALLIIAGVTMRRPLIEFFNPPPSIRLAILPLERSNDISANGALLDVVDRLERRTGPPTLIVIPPSRNLDNNVQTPDQARQLLGATHALQVSIRREGNDFVTTGAVMDLSTQTRLQEISGRYSMAGDLSTALTGAVSKALRLRGASSEPISAVAAAPYLQGLAHLRRNQHSFDLAIPLFQQARSLDPHSPLPAAGMAEALVLKYGDTRDGRSLAEADQTLHAAEALNPDSVAVLLAAGRLEGVRGQYEKALENYRRVAELQPQNVEVWLRMAEMHDRLNHRNDAIENYQKAIELDPAYYETYEELGVFFYKRGEYTRAAEEFRKVTRRARGFSNAYTNLGATLSDMGEDEAAASALAVSLKIKETAGALNSLAAIKAYQKHDAEALVLYKRSLAINPNNYVCLMNAGDSSRRLRRADEARGYYQKGLETALKQLKNNPADGSTRAYVGYFFGRLGDVRRAEEEIDQALELSPADKTVIRRGVLTFEMLGRRDRSLAVAGRATPDSLRELDRHPDLADFRQDPRFRELKAKKEKGG